MPAPTPLPSSWKREFATGDRIQFTAPNKDLGLANRDLGTVLGREGGNLTVRLDGKAERIVTFDTAEFRQFDHGYSVTSHSSQGLTAGRVIANIDTESSRSLINTRLAYVAISRASEDARIYTNNAETLARPPPSIFANGVPQNRPGRPFLHSAATTPPPQPSSCSSRAVSMNTQTRTTA
jgi:ATP-dependent exoDNAse (exonuclease V) alpha subunit